MATMAGREVRRPISAADSTMADGLKPVFDAIAESRAILAWPDNWDGEGSPRYDDATWNRATAFVGDNAIRLWEDEGKLMDAPDIQPGALGRIVIEWSVGDRELIVVIPANAGEQAEFYGHDDGRTITIKGELDTTSPLSSWLLLWTTR